MVGDDGMIIFSYNMNTLVTSSTTVNCGSPVVVFTTSTGFSIEVIFIPVCDSMTGDCQLTVYTD